MSDVLLVLQIISGALALARQFGLTMTDVFAIVEEAQAEGRDVTREDLARYAQKRKEALSQFDQTVEGMPEAGG